MKKIDETIDIKLNKDFCNTLPSVASELPVQKPLKRRPLKKRIKRDQIKDIWADYDGAQLPSMKSKNSRKSQVFESSKPIIAEKTVHKKRRVSKFQKALSLCLFALFAFLAIYCATKVNLWRTDNENNDAQMAQIQELVKEKTVENDEVIDNSPIEKTEQVSLKDYDLTKLKSINPDTVGYIKMNGLDVDAPFVQTTDNDFYLNHSFDKSVNAAGWLFGDYRNDWDNLKKNTIIYGHNRSNNKMFGSLKLIFEESWYSNKDNHYIYISTDKVNMVFEIFSAYIIPTETYYLRNYYDTEDEHKEFLDTISSRSKIDFGVEVSTQDKILTLSTCYTNATKTVVHAKLLTVQNR